MGSRESCAQEVIHMVTTRLSRSRGGEEELDRFVLAFDDEHAVANAGLVLVGTLVERLGIEQVVDETLDLGERAAVGLRGLRPELTRRLAAVDATEAEFTRRTPPLSELLELDLVRSVLQTHLRWLTRTEKTLARQARANDNNR
jgi:hypothetical protein